MPVRGLCAEPDAAPATRAVESGSIRLYEVSIDGWPRGLVARFRDEGGRLSLPASQWEGLGFKPIPELTITVAGEPRIYLDAVPGLTFKVDTRKQSIDIKAAFDLLQPQRLAVSPGPPFVKSHADWGVMLAYDAFVEWGADPHDPIFARQVSTNLDARLFGPGFSFRTTSYLSVPMQGERRYVRLDTTLDFDDPDRSRRLRLGDSMTVEMPGAQSLRFGGVQWGTETSLRPDIITSPQPVLRQDLALPTTLDLFIDGVQRYSRALEPGAFRISDLPLAAGQNRVQVMLTDPSGRRVAQTLPLYQTPDLLARGRTQFSLAAGFERQDYAAESNQYGAGFLAGHVEHGISDRITAFGQAEAAKGYWNLGGGALVNVWNRFQLGGEASLSSDLGRQAVAWYMVMERTTGRLDLSVSYGRAAEDYRDLPGHFGYSRTTERGTASVGLNLGKAGQFNLVYVVQKPVGSPRSQVASASYELELFNHRAHLSAMGYSDLVSGDWGAGLTLTIPLGRDVRVTAGVNRDTDGTNRSLELDGEGFDRRLEWNLTAVDGPDRAWSAEATWDGRHADLYARVAEEHGSNGLQAEVAQSIVFMDHQLFVAGRIDDGFTVVDAPDAPRVQVLLENRPVGRTNAKGRLLVPDLQSYVGNAVSLAPLDLPLDVQLANAEMLVAPREGAGLITRFATRRERAAVIVLRLADGKPPPVGAGVRLEGAEDGEVMGYDGEVYVRGLKVGPNRLDLSWPEGHCRASFTAPELKGRLPRLGPFTCAP